MKYFSICVSVIAFLCWIVTYSLLKEQFDYMKSNETRVKEINEVYIKKYDELEKELKVKIDSTNTILKNINTNMYSIQKKIPNFR